jgi:Transposase DNA-binding/Transposase DDE domain
MELTDETVARIAREFGELELGDPRRTRRVVKLVQALAKHPQASLPEALGTHSELEAAYRILNNESFDFEDLLTEHGDRTIARAEHAGDVLVVHDTTTCVFEHADPREVGALPTGKAGFFAHVALVVDARKHRRPLGVVHVEAYWRDQRSGRGSRKKHLNGKEVAAWEGRESERWARGVQHAQEKLDGCRVIHVMDREADKYELMAHMLAHDQRFVLRSQHDRRLSSGSSEAIKLRDAMAAQQVMVERDVYASRRPEASAPRARATHPPRFARTAKLAVNAAALTFRRPNSLATEFVAELAINVVHVQEVDPPAGQKPIAWTLLTSEPIQTIADVERVIDIYRYRWLIEELFKALKSGCMYEKRLFEERHALLNLLAVSLPIAVELLWMRARVADDPEAPWEDVITPTQLEVLRTMAHRPLPKTPTAAEVLLAVAGLGGHLKQNGAPGWQVLHRGYRRLLDYEAGWKARERAKSSRPKPRNL